METPLLLGHTPLIRAPPLPCSAQVDAQEADGVGPELTVKQERLVYYLVQVWTPPALLVTLPHMVTPHLW